MVHGLTNPNQATLVLPAGTVSAAVALAGTTAPVIGPANVTVTAGKDTIGYADPVIEYLVKNVGADRILMGSDYCFPVAYEQPVEVVVGNPLIAAGDRHAILEGNARRLLRL